MPNSAAKLERTQIERCRRVSCLMSSLVRHFARSLIGCWAILVLGACGQNPAQIFSDLDPNQTVKIATLAERSAGSKVVVEGRVLSIAPLVKQSVYELQDESGVIWVLTDRQPPSQNSQVKVHGVIRESNGERYIDQK